ncbi:MAG: efflux RND transporter permease subunit [Myxococcales bacterium]
MWLTRLALRNPVLILMVSLMTIVLGFVSLRRLSVDLFPDITIPVIRVATFYPGAGPGDIEQTITQPIERAVAASPGVDRVESISRQGVSVVSVWFNFGTNLDNAQFEVSQRVAQILNTLPPGLQQPFVLKFDISNIPVVAVAISGDGLDERQVYDLAYNTVEPQLERLPGVASASVGGGKVREITVAARADALKARNLDLLDVVDAVRRSNLLLPSGNLKAGDRDYNVFANTQVSEAKPLEDVVVRAGNNAGGAGRNPAAVRIRDVASVVDGAADQAEIVRINGQRGVYLRVLKQPGANTIAVVDAIRAAMPNLRGVPPNVKLAISFDQSTYVRSAVAALEHEGVQGGLLAVLVILIFLVSLRATGIIAVAIPLSVVATFILLYFSRQTLNVFTLGGLALAVGRLVDDSIVELENIHRHLGLGQPRRQAILAAAQEVAMPILVSTITTIVVFFPVLFLRGVAQNLFLPLALTISFSLIVSFFVSRTVTPLLCLYVLRAHRHTPGARAAATEERGLPAKIRRGLDRLDSGYAGLLAWVLSRRLRAVAIIFLLFAASLLLKRGIGTEFFPDTDESQFTGLLKGPVGTRVERTEDISARVERAVQSMLGGTSTGPAGGPAGGRMYTTILSDSGLPGGRTALFTTNTGPHTANVQVNLVPLRERPFSDVTASERVRAALRDALPGVQLYFFVGGIVKRILNFGAAAPIDVEILGHDLERGGAYAKQLLARVREVRDAAGRPYLTDVQVTREENYPEMDIVVDREKAGILGLSEQQVAQNVLASLVGSTQFSPVPFTDARTGNEYFVNVRLDDRFRSHVSDLADIFIRTPAGGTVPLGNIAQIRRSSGPVVINRKYLQRIVDVTANVAPGQDLGAASVAVEQAMAALPPPEGFTARLGGQTEEQRKAFADLGFAAILAIVLVYMVLASQFKSLVDPLVIMFSVPLGVGGVFVMLFLTHTSLSVNSFMGIIMMVGIVVSNGVLLVDFANVLRRRGKPLIEATVEAARTRLRPILMTTIATVVGLAPMALGLGEGSEANLPLARAVIGGLTVSTIFTLFLVPALYTLFDRFAKRTVEEDDSVEEDSIGGHAAEVGHAAEI